MTVPRRDPYLVLLAVSVGVFMTMLDTTVVYVASPRIVSALGATIDEGLWIIDAYILAFGVLLITAGRLGEIFGPRRLFIVGLALFAMASIAAGLAPDVRSLIAARALQGIAGALLEPQAAALIVGAFPVSRLGAALGVFGAVLGLSALVGPTLGGFIVTHASWRWIFLLNVPFAVLAIIMTRVLAPRLLPTGRPRLDIAGSTLLTVGLLAIVFTLVEGQRFAWAGVWGPITVPRVFGAGLIVLAAFAVCQRVAREPLVPLSMFRRKEFATMVLIAAGVDFALQGFIVAFSLCFQFALGMNAFEAGLTFAPLSIAGGIAAPIAGRLVDRHGGRFVVGGGLLVVALGAMASARVAEAQVSGVFFVPSMVVTGLGLAAVLGPVTAVVMREAGAERAGTASGVLNTSRQVGGLFGIAVLGAILQNRFAANFGDAVARSSTLGDDTCVSAVRASVARVPTLGTGLAVDCPRESLLVVEELVRQAFVAALQPATLLAALLLVACAAACFFLVSRGGSSSRAPEGQA